MAVLGRPWRIGPFEVAGSFDFLERFPIPDGVVRKVGQHWATMWRAIGRTATRPIAGGDWTPLTPLLSPVPISPLGGVTLVSIDLGVMAIAVSFEGVVCSALSVDGLPWSPLAPLP